jgi:hypothetical protein
MQNRPHYIHLEGMDLAGKTTARHGLLAALGGAWEVRHNSLGQANPLYELADRLRREGGLGAAPLGYLYVAALAADLEWYEPPKGNVIQDSTILLRSLAFHTVAGTPYVREALAAQLPRHPRFTRSFVLTASLEARRERLEHRRSQQATELSEDDLLVLRAPGRFLAMEQELVRLAREHFDAVVIDTSTMSESAVVDSLLIALACPG